MADGVDGVVTIDLDPAVCPYLPICDPVVGGTIVMRDATHLSVQFARTLVGPVEEALHVLGVIGERDD